MKFIFYSLIVFTTLMACILTFNGCKDKNPEPEVVITSIAPTQGVAGTAVVISGTHFSEIISENSVMFNGKLALVTSATVTEIVTVVPLDCGTGKVTLKTGSTVIAGPEFVYLIPPKISSISPVKGTVGTKVTITGTNFSSTPSNNAIRFNGKVATVLTSTETQLVTVVPSEAGSGKVSVTTDSGLSEGPDFNYFDSPTILTINPTSARHNNSVVITGTNFDPSFLTAKINGKSLPIVFSSTSQLTITIPKGIGTGKVSIETTGGNIDGPVFTYLLTATVTTLAGDGNPGYVEGVGANAKLDTPSGITFDTDGNLYVCERGNYLIRKITPEGVTTTFAGSGLAGSSDGSAHLAKFRRPSGITSDGLGNFYIADAGNHSIRKVSAVGDVSTLAGAGSGSPGFVDGIGIGANFNFPTSLIVDLQGNLIVADYLNYRLRKLTTSGVVSTIAGNGSSDFIAGNGIMAHIGSVWGIVKDSDSNFYFSNYDGHRILKMTPSGDITSFAGDGTLGFSDGPKESAKFSSLSGIAIDKSGALIVSDVENNCIRRISEGIVTTIAGDGISGFVNGEGDVARFNLPFGLGINSAGEIFVCDRSNHSIRKIVLE
jgi:sugar lactone lactonase YvrE